MTPNEVRAKYLAFFESKGHAILPSAPLVPENDPTTLFTGSGG
ncbi:MAG: Alanine-tRNA ligase [Parcubacteria group bacterium GW2011_GWA1_53_13]|nr:MAG: Alanine-tRNA ligase [Parcubacteria group bacterium GW2011_GWA1_53_13]